MQDTHPVRRCQKLFAYGYVTEGLTLFRHLTSPEVSFPLLPSEYLRILQSCAVPDYSYRITRDQHRVPILVYKHLSDTGPQRITAAVEIHDKFIDTVRQSGAAEHPAIKGIAIAAYSALLDAYATGGLPGTLAVPRIFDGIRNHTLYLTSPVPIFPSTRCWATLVLALGMVREYRRATTAFSEAILQWPVPDPATHSPHTLYQHQDGTPHTPTATPSRPPIFLYNAYLSVLLDRFDTTAVLQQFEDILRYGDPAPDLTTFEIAFRAAYLTGDYRRFAPLIEAMRHWSLHPNNLTLTTRRLIAKHLTPERIPHRSSIFMPRPDYKRLYYDPIYRYQTIEHRPAEWELPNSEFLEKESQRALEGGARSHVGILQQHPLYGMVPRSLLVADADWHNADRRGPFRYISVIYYSIVLVPIYSYHSTFLFLFFTPAIMWTREHNFFFPQRVPLDRPVKVGSSDATVPKPSQTDTLGMPVS